jgi:hypothetical protein
MSFKIVKGHAANGIDKLARNKFRTEWLDGVYCVNSEKVKYGDSIDKINEDGKCYCMLCKKMIDYGSSGKKALAMHCKILIDEVIEINTCDLIDFAFICLCAFCWIRYEQCIYTCLC